MKRQYSIETSTSERGPWKIVDALESEKLSPVITLARELVPNRDFTWVRIVPDDQEEHATVIRPKYR